MGNLGNINDSPLLIPITKIVSGQQSAVSSQQSAVSGQLKKNLIWDNLKVP